MLDALAFLHRIEHQRHPDMQQAPLEVVPSAWRRLVKPPRASVVDRHAYTLCAVERLPDHLRRRDVFVPRSERWGDSRIKLLQGEQWEVLRPQVCRALGWSESPEPELHALSQQLDEAYRRTATNFSANETVGQAGGRPCQIFHLFRTCLTVGFFAREVAERSLI